MSRRPEAVFVLGPHAAGKTTMIRQTLAGHDHVAQAWSNDPAEVGDLAREAERAFRSALQAGRSVAVESVGTRDLDRRRQAALDAGYDVRTVRLPCAHPRRVTPEGRHGTFRCLDCGAEGSV